MLSYVKTTYIQIWKYLNSRVITSNAEMIFCTLHSGIVFLFCKTNVFFNNEHHLAKIVIYYY